MPGFWIKLLLIKGLIFLSHTTVNIFVVKMLTNSISEIGPGKLIGYFPFYVAIVFVFKSAMGAAISKSIDY